MTERQRAAEMDLRYVRFYDATNDVECLRPYHGEPPHGVVLLTADEAKASGLPIR